GFRTKGEAKEWERDFLQQQSQGVDIIQHFITNF
ncbi:Arm DNA-binding domain-containing protein, partial [Fusicatenibacter faecihominis]